MALPKDYPVYFKRSGNFLEVFHSQTRQRLAYCYVGDDLMVEKIADILSAKRLGLAAMELRELPKQPPPPSLPERLLQAAPPWLQRMLPPS